MSKQRHIRFSIIMPARNEEGNVEAAVRELVECFEAAGIEDYEILGINDNSSDQTGAILQRLAGAMPTVSYFQTEAPGGFGRAVRLGLQHYRGNAATLVMADRSEHPRDALLYYREIARGARCVFGSRFIAGGGIYDYPIFKKIINRLGNSLINILFGVRHGDITNGFKAYHREVLDSLRPLNSNGFELSLELPLKAIIRGHPFQTVPVGWRGRVSGRSKFIIPQVCARYLLTVGRLLLLTRSRNSPNK